MYTANTMSTAIEAMGLSLPGSSSVYSSLETPLFNFDNAQDSLLIWIVSQLVRYSQLDNESGGLSKSLLSKQC